MIHFICTNSVNVWASGPTVEHIVETIGQIGSMRFDHVQVSQFERRNLVDAQTRWYFDAYLADGEFSADDAEKLGSQGEFLGSFALISREEPT